MFLVIGITCLAIALFVFWVEPLSIVSVLERLTPNVKYRVRTNRPSIALSFDDGPHPIFTPQVLEILESHQAQATFFLIGERARRYPELVARIKSEGHEVANHYSKNGSTLGHSDSAFLSHLEDTENAIVLTAPKLFRAPGGIARSRQIKLAKANGYVCVLGTAYPHDPLHPPIWYTKWLIKKNLVPGTIVILHDGISDPTRSIKALPDVLKHGREKGLTFVSIGALMRERQEQGTGRCPVTRPGVSDSNR